MDFMIMIAEGFIGMFEAGAEVFMGYMTGIIPLLVTLITAVNAITKMIGEEKINGFIQKNHEICCTPLYACTFYSSFFLHEPNVLYSWSIFTREI